MKTLLTNIEDTSMKPKKLSHRLRVAINTIICATKYYSKNIHTKRSYERKVEKQYENFLVFKYALKCCFNIF